MDSRSSYTPELAAEICERLETGESLRSICRDIHMPTEGCVRKWAREDVEGFAERYTRSRDLGLDAMADELIEIAKDGTNDYTQIEDSTGRMRVVVDHDHISRSKLRVDVHKWLLTALASKKYGNKVAHELSGPDGGPIATVVTDESRAALAAALFARAGATLLGQYFDRQPDLVAGPEEPPAA